jgi:DNA-binding transcriptional regulator YiaG
MATLTEKQRGGRRRVEAPEQTAQPSGESEAAREERALPAIVREDGESVRSTRLGLGLSRRSFSRMTGFSERAIADWEAGKALGGASRQRVLEMRRLKDALAEVIDPRQLGRWLEQPNPAFDGLKPLEAVERGEVDRLWSMIFYLRSGVPG